MKKRTAFISLCLCICMLLTMLKGSSALPVLAQEETTAQKEAMLTGISELPAKSANDVIFEKVTRENVPDIIGYEAATEKGHIARLKNEEKDLYSFVFRNADGTNTLYTYSDPVKYIDENGEVKDKSNKVVVDNSKSGSYTNGDNDIRVNFPSIIDNGISLSYNDIKISMKPSVKSGSAIGLNDKIIDTKTGEKQTYSVKYDKVFGDNTYITYTPTYTGFKEDIILTEYTGQSEFEFTLYTNGLELFKDGDILFLRNAKGEVVANLGQVIIHTADNGNNSLGESDFLTINDNQEYTVIIKVDPDYLADPKTVYPVTIDPTITLTTTSQIEDARISIGAMGGVGSGTETETTIGADYNGHGTSRMLVKFPALNSSNYTFSTLYSSQITSAYIKTYVESPSTYGTTIKSYAYTTSWAENSVVGNISTWDSYYDTATMSSSYVSSTAGDKYISILNTVKSWCNYNRGVSGGRNPEYGLILINGNEANTLYNRTLYTSENANPLEIIIHYNPTIVNNEVYYIKNKDSGKYLTVSGNTASSYKNVVQRNIGQTGTDINAQRWKIVYLGNDLYKIVSMLNENYYLHVTSDNVDIYGGLTNNTKWKIIRNSDLHSYRIVSMSSNYVKAVNIAGASCENDANAITYPYQNGQAAPNDEWIFEPVHNASTALMLDYRNAYWNSHSPTYPYFQNWASDCTNYVSQCMLAEGIHFQGAWWIYKKNHNNPIPANNSEFDESWEVETIGGILGFGASSPWFSAKQFNNFWIDIVDTTTWDLTYVRDHQSEIYNSQYEIGDVVMFLNNNGTPGHAMIIVGRENGDFLLSGHNNNRKAYPLQTAVNSYLTEPSDYNSGAIRFYKMK